MSGFWNRILVASVTARAGLSEAWPISYIQYIGVVSAALPSPAGPRAAKIHQSAYVPRTRFCVANIVGVAQ